MVQIITYNKNKFQTFADTYKISELGEFDSFDDYNINIIDLSNESMWRYSENIINSINAISDFRTLSKELDLIKKTKIVIVLPQNVYYKYHWINYKNAFNYAIKIKDILPNVIDIISKNLILKVLKYLIVKVKQQLMVAHINLILILTKLMVIFVAIYQNQIIVIGQPQ